MDALQAYSPEVKLRRGLPQLQGKKLRNEPITVAFLGGSITEGYGAEDPDKGSYRALTGQYLTEVFGLDKVTCINAGVGGTTSTFGAHRFQEHVMVSGGIDLLFVEFSVNDGADREESIRGMEGIVRQCSRLNPEADICFLYTADDDNLSIGTPFNIAVHEEVAAHYNLPSVNFAAYVREWIRSGQATWEELAPDRTHPNDAGYRLYADRLCRFLATLLNEQEAVELKPKPIHAAAITPLEAGHLAYASMRSITELELPTSNSTSSSSSSSSSTPTPTSSSSSNSNSNSTSFQLRDLTGEPVMNWRYQDLHLFTDQPGDTLTFEIKARGVGVLALWGPASGIFEYAINNGAFVQVNEFDAYCLGAYRPIITPFAVFEEVRSIAITIRNTGEQDERSLGMQLRLLKLLVIEE